MLLQKQHDEMQAQVSQGGSSLQRDLADMGSVGSADKDSADIGKGLRDAAKDDGHLFMQELDRPVEVSADCDD